MDNQIRIIEFIWKSKKEKLRFGDLVKGLKDYMSRGTLNNHLKILAKNGYINHKEHIYSRNRKKLFPYGELYKQYKIKLGKQQKINRKLMEDHLEITKAQAKIRDYIENELELNLFTRNPFYLSDNRERVFEDHIISFLCECFFYNPDNWYLYNDPENLKFKFTIEVDLSRKLDFLEHLKKYKEYIRKNGVFYSFNSIYPYIKNVYFDIEKKEEMDLEDLNKYLFLRTNLESLGYPNITGKSDEDLYAIAKYEHETRNNRTPEYKKRIEKRLKEMSKKMREKTDKYVLGQLRKQNLPEKEIQKKMRDREEYFKKK